MKKFLGKRFHNQSSSLCFNQAVSLQFSSFSFLTLSLFLFLSLSFLSISFPLFLSLNHSLHLLISRGKIAPLTFGSFILFFVLIQTLFHTLIKFLIQSISIIFQILRFRLLKHALRHLLYRGQPLLSIH